MADLHTNSVRVSCVADEDAADPKDPSRFCAEEGGGPLSWFMEFEGTCQTKFSFTVLHPAMHTLEQWQDLAEGRGGIIYMNNSSWSGIRAHGNDMVFELERERDDDCMSSRIKVPRELVQNALSTAIAEVRARGLAFKDTNAETEPDEQSSSEIEDSEVENPPTTVIARPRKTQRGSELLEEPLRKRANQRALARLDEEMHTVSL